VIARSLMVKPLAVKPRSHTHLTAGPTAIHMWTAPGPQEEVQRADRIACDHMSGLLMRSHMTAAKMGFAT